MELLLLCSDFLLCYALHTGITVCHYYYTTTGLMLVAANR